MPTKPLVQQSANSVALEYAGQWVAWNSDHSQVLAHSNSIKDLWRIVRDGQVKDPIFEKVPRGRQSRDLA
jgi:hypothetical protein